MLNSIVHALDFIEDSLWQYMGFPAIIFIGIWFSIQSKFAQIRKFPDVIRIFLDFLMGRDTNSQEEKKGIHPLKAFFTGLGGCVGIGNIIGITLAVQLGGPGAIFWVWVAAVFGSLVKYSEVYLGIQYRVCDNKEGFHGGPMYFLSKAIGPWAGTLFCWLMCVYGVEIFQFNVIVTSVATNCNLERWPVVLVILLLVLLAERGGMRRVANICTAIIPLFILVYLSMCFYVIGMNVHLLADVFIMIVKGAFTPQSAFGGFLGSTVLLTISHGIRRGCYSSDIGVGYAAIIHSASRVTKASKQAALAIFEVFLDSCVICTISVLIILITGTWNEPLEPMQLVEEGLSIYFPYMHFFMPFFLFLLGYSTIITFFEAGIQTATYLSPHHGKLLYYGFSTLFLFSFAFVDTVHAIMPLSIVQVFLLALNLIGFYRLRREIDFNFLPASKEPKEEPVQEVNEMPSPAYESIISRDQLSNNSCE